MTLILWHGGWIGSRGRGKLARNRTLAKVSLQRAASDPISTPDHTVTLQNAQTQADVTGVRVIIYRELDGTKLGEATGGPSVVIPDVGFYGAGQSDLRVVALKVGFRPQVVASAQGPAGGTTTAGLIPDIVYKSGVSLNPGAVVLDTVAKTIQLTESVTGQDLYSHLVDEYVASATLPETDFPMVARSATSYELRAGWDFLDDTSRGYVRGAGWLVTNTSEQLTAIYSNVKTLGDIDGAEIIRYQQASGGSVVAWPAGHVDRALLVYSDPDGDGTPTTDLRSYLRVIVDTEGRTRSDVDVLASLSVVELEADSYPVAVSTAADASITATDADIDTLAPYTGMSLVYEASPVLRTVGSDTSPYSNTIDANGGTKAQVYSWWRRQQRKAGTVGSGAGAVNGWDTPNMLTYAGGALTSLRTNSRGCFVILSAAEQASTSLTDDDGHINAYPDFPTKTFTFSSNLVGGEWRMWTAATYPGASPTAVTDADGATVHGTIPPGGVVSFSWDRDGAGADLAFHIAAENAGTARRVDLAGTLTASDQGFTLTADDETAEVYTGVAASSVIDGAAGTITPPGAFTAGDYRSLYVDWANWNATGEGLKWTPAFDVSGGDDLGGGQSTDVDLFMQTGWSVVFNHSIEWADGASNLRRQGGGTSHLVAGAGVKLVLLPSSRRGLVSETEGISGTTAAKVGEIHKLHGLDAAAPVEIRDDQQTAGPTITLNVAADGTKTTISRG